MRNSWAYSWLKVTVLADSVIIYYFSNIQLYRQNVSLPALYYFMWSAVKFFAGPHAA